MESISRHGQKPRHHRLCVERSCMEPPWYHVEPQRQWTFVRSNALLRTKCSLGWQQLDALQIHRPVSHHLVRKLLRMELCGHLEIELVRGQQQWNSKAVITFWVLDNLSSLSFHYSNCWISGSYWEISMRFEKACLPLHEVNIPKSIPMTGPLTFLSASSEFHRLVNDDPNGVRRGAERETDEVALGSCWVRKISFCGDNVIVLTLLQFENLQLWKFWKQTSLSVMLL